MTRSRAKRLTRFWKHRCRTIFLATMFGLLEIGCCFHTRFFTVKQKRWRKLIRVRVMPMASSKTEEQRPQLELLRRRFEGSGGRHDDENRCVETFKTMFNAEEHGKCQLLYWFGLLQDCNQVLANHTDTWLHQRVWVGGWPLSRQDLCRAEWKTQQGRCDQSSLQRWSCWLGNLDTLLWPLQVAFWITMKQRGRLLGKRFGDSFIECRIDKFFFKTIFMTSILMWEVGMCQIRYICKPEIDIFSLLGTWNIF